MKVYSAPRIMQALVKFKQHIKKEASSMHFEDLRSYTLRCDQMIEQSYKNGRNDLLKELASDLGKSFGALFPVKYREIVEKISEIFRSRESLTVVKTVECHVSDLYRMLKDTQRIIQMFEDGISDTGRLKLKKFKINVRVRKDEVLDVLKDDIAEMFKSSLNNEISNEITQYITSLKNELKTRETEEEPVIIEPYTPDLLIDTIDEFHTRGVSSMSMGDMLSLKYQKQQKQLMREKEWENKEIKRLREKCRTKKRNLKLKERQHKESEDYLKKKNLEIVKEKAEIERLRDNYYREKNRIKKNYEDKSRKLSEVINELTVTSENPETVGKISPITETEMLSDISFLSDMDSSFDSSIGEPDITSLQRRIADLEGQFKSESCIEIQDRLKRDIDSLKNSLTNLRSSQALKNSSQNQKRFSFNRNISLTEITCKRPTPVSTPLPPSIQTPKQRLSLTSSRPLFRSSAATPKSSSHHFNFNEVSSVNEEETEKKKFLRALEVKIYEKQERFEKERNSWLEKWSRLPDANQLIPMVQKEIIEYKKKCDEFDRKIKEIHEKEAEFSRKEGEVKKKESELDNKIKEINEKTSKLEEERTSILEKLGKLREDLEGR
jgi:DNA repair exonuclease SbcCD ATPase subunit